MKPKYVKVQNFGSYDSLELTFDKEGLTLIAGPTGAGKSTLCDALPWVLFGKTAKNGSVDDVRSWHTKEATIGVAEVEVAGQIVTVTRFRGVVSDMWFRVGYGEEIRGKDRIDTQRLLNEALRMDIDTYLSSSYYHEFSEAAAFFTANAKARRAFTEQLADLAFAKILAERLAEKSKIVKSTQADLETSIESQKARSQALLEVYNQALESFKDGAKHFEEHKAARLEILFQRLADKQKYAIDSTTFETTLSALQDALREAKEAKCDTCGGPLHSADVESLQEAIDQERQVQHKNEGVLRDIERLQEEITRVSNEVQPENTVDLEKLLLKAQRSNDVCNLHNENLKAARVALANLNTLSDVVSSFRASLIANTVAQLANETNRLLSNHFDAEIKVTFTAESTDKINVDIAKDGNICSFVQLSKGQRQLLKFCFGMAVVKAVRENNGVGNSPLWIDEAFDGLSEEFKVKAFGLLSAVSKDYSTIYVVEHSQELKSLFASQVKVSMINGRSTLEEA